jgi:hypothetical protein
VEQAVTATATHLYGRRIREAGLGDFPARDHRPEVSPALPGPCDAVAFFSDHVVVAADVTEDWVSEQDVVSRGRPVNDASTGFGLFLSALSERLGNPPMAVSSLLAAPYKPAYVHGDYKPGGDVDPDWSAYRTGVRSYRYRGTGVRGVFALAQGPGGRWEAYVRVDEDSGFPASVSRDMLSAARSLSPDRELLFASAPLHDPRVIRAAVGGGFLPICTEALLLTRPAG